MWNTISLENIDSVVDLEEFASLKKQADEPWFSSLINTIKKYKDDFFSAETSSTTYLKQQRMLDYTVPPNYKFVLARYVDGFYRPASLMGRNKKLHLFVVLFYHTGKCCFLKRKYLVIKHGNLLDKKVYFRCDGQSKRGTVYGNNSPANDGFPSIFYVKRKDDWYRVSFKEIFLTKKQVNKIYFVEPKKKRRCSSVGKSRSDSQSSR